MLFLFFRRADALLSSEPGGGQGHLATHTVAQDCMFFCLLFFVMHVLFSFCNAFSAINRHSPPLRGTVGCATFPFRIGFRLFVSPPRHDGACGRVLMLVSLVLAPVFSFNSPFFVSPPRHTDGTREGFDGGCLAIAPFLSRPPATLAVRGRFLRVVCLITVSAFPSITFLRVFPGFIARPFRGVGVGFEEPHLRFMV